MKILVLNYRDRMHPEAGGAERHLHQVFGRIAKQGHEVVLFTTHFKGALEREWVDGILVIRCGGDLLFQITVLRNFKKLDAEFNFDFIYEDLNKLPLFTPFLTRKPHLIQIHHLWRNSIFREIFFPIAFGVWLFETLIPLLYRKSHFVTGGPSTVKELMQLGIDKNRISLVYYGADGLPSGYVLPSEKEKFFLWLSRVHRYKGILIALDAFKIFMQRNPESGMQLRVAGDGPLLAKLPEILKNIGMQDHVVLEGRVSASRKTDLFAHALCLLQTSYKEGWGLTVIEAGETGTTTVASNVPGLCDSVVDGKTGLLFPLYPQAAESCAMAMERIYKEVELRKQLEAEAQKWASTFSWDRAAQESLALIQELAGKK
jgi:glycosyltransferase involved in cell wall biosynthesis